MTVVSQRQPVLKRRSNAIPIVDPTTNSVIDPLAGKPETSAVAVTEESSFQVQ